MTTETDVTDISEEIAQAEAQILDEAAAEESENREAAEEGSEPGAEPAEIDAAEAEEGAEPEAQLSAEELPQAIEAILLVSQAPLSMAQLKEHTGKSADAIQEALTVLAERYHPDRSGIVLAEIANGWVFKTSERQKAIVRKLLGVKPQRLTRAALETLALVAYRQPITRPEMEDVRGVDCGAVLKALLDRRMVRILGKKEEPGRPLLYGTSKEFLEFFGLKSLTSLPTLREFHELTEESRSIVEKETGESPESIEGIAALADGMLANRLAETADEGADAMADLEAAMQEAELRAKRIAEEISPAKDEAADAPPPELRN
jgi:segregation and condensation protein B